ERRTRSYKIGDIDSQIARNQRFGDFIGFRIKRFFFSSRRRHTRCLSDWSSDVCSSDLFVKGSEIQAAVLQHASTRKRHLASLDRSEERRVGKERSSRGVIDI